MPEEARPDKRYRDEQTQELTSTDSSPDGSEMHRATLSAGSLQTFKMIEPLHRIAIPGYEILEELGRGGMGVVYKARQSKLNRVVALKMIIAGTHASAADLVRFLAEAEAEAGLHHPNIVQLFESGQHEGLPYFTLEFVEGGTLGVKLDAGLLPASEAATVLESMARGVAHAHAHGIVHRDLKPDNILLTGSGEPKITDFGLAKRLQSGAGVTQTGAVMGTPGYMAPEQARGETVGTAADVYALGAILYRMLAGRPPFHADTPMNTLAQVLRDEPVHPRRLNPKAPRDLEVICLKCLQKAPTKRYASAEALADDLKLYLEGKPITARPVGKGERLVKWVKRRPTAAALVLVAVLVALGGLSAGIWFGAKIRDERDHTRAAFDDAQRRAEAERDALEESQRQKRLAEAMLVDMQTNFGVIALGQNKSPVAALWFASAVAIGNQSLEQQFANRVRFDLARRDAVAPLRAFEHGGEELRDLKLRADGLFLITQTKSGRFTLWDVEKEMSVPFPGKGEVTAAAWSNDGLWLAIARGGRVEVWDQSTGEHLQELTHSEPVEVLEFDASRRYLAVAGKSARVWDCRARKFATAELSHPMPVIHLVFSPTGDMLATSCEDNTARVFPLRELGWTSPRFYPHLVNGSRSLRIVQIAPAFAGDGRLLVTITSSTSAAGWGLVSGGGVWTQQGGEPINSLAVSPDGRTLIVGGFTKIVSLDARTGAEVRTSRPHKHFTSGLGHSPDGKLLISVSFDRTARLTDEHGISSSEVTHQDGLLQMAVARSRNVFATAQFDGLVRLWSFAADALPHLPYGGPGEAAEPPALSADGTLCLPSTAGGVARVYSTNDGKVVGAPLPLPGRMQGSVFLSDGRSVLLWGSRARTYSDVFEPMRHRGWFERRDWKTGELLLGPVDTPSTVMAAAVSPGGRDLVLACANNEILVLDLATGGKKKSATFKTIAGTTFKTVAGTTGWWYLLPVTVSFHPTENHCVVGGLGKSIYHIDTAKGEILHRLDAGELTTTALFTPGGELIVAGSIGKEVRFWDAATGKAALPSLIHPDWTFRLAFSADGNYLATAGRDNRARVWNWTTGELLAALEHPNEAYDVCFSPDGRWLFTIGRDGKGRVWEWRAGKPAGPLLSFPANMTQIPTLTAFFTPNGRRLVCAGAGLFDVEGLIHSETGDLPKSDRLRLGMLLAGQKIGANSNLVNLTSSEWLGEWRQFRAAHRELLPLPPVVAAPAPLKIEPWPSAPPLTGVVKLPPVQEKRRAATFTEIVIMAAKLGGDGHVAAEKWLREVGPPAAGVLAAAELSATPQQRAALRTVRDQIDLAEALRPRKLGLKFKGTPLRDAIGELAKAGGVPLSYFGNSDVKVTLDLSQDAFWPGIKKLCTEVGLFYSVYGNEVHLIDGKAAPAGWSADAGMVYVRAVNLSQTNYIDFASGAATRGALKQLYLDVYPDLSVPIVGIGSFNLTALEGPDGKAIEIKQPQYGPNLPQPLFYGAISWSRSIPLNLPTKVDGSLQRLEATLPIAVDVRRREKCVITGNEFVEGKIVPINGGGRLTILKKRASGGMSIFDIQVDTGGFWNVDANRHAIELTDDDGIRRRGSIFQPSTVARFVPEDLLMLGSYSLAGLVWQTRLRAPTSCGQATLSFRSVAPIGAKSRLVFYEADRLTTQVKILLKDLPLP